MAGNWGISAIVPSYNGRELLRRNLPSLIEAMDSSGRKYEIIVVDDASSDSTAEFIANTYHSIKLIRLEQRRGFSSAVNCGVRKARYEKVLLLNSDIEVKRDFLWPLSGYFENERVFAVSNKAMQDEKITLTKSHTLEFRYGFLKEVRKEERGCASFAFGASGGHAIFDKAKFLELSGFDEIFSPFYYEDADLSYRAWKRGYLVYYEPRSIVYHQRKSTIGRFFSPAYVKLIFHRNVFIFLWKNLTDWDLLLCHLFFLPFYLLLGSIKRPYLIVSFFWAIAKLNKIFEARRKEKPFIRYKDRGILKLIKED